MDTNIIYDIITNHTTDKTDKTNVKTTNPDIIFNGLQFKLINFNFTTDLIFKNMKKINDSDILDSPLLISYEFNYDNILEKLKDLFPLGIVEISDQ
jgi:hypothetical protein